MIDAGEPSSGRLRWIGPACLLLAAGFFGYLDPRSPVLGAAVALVLAGAAVGIRSVPGRRLSALAPVPALAALVLSALLSPLGLVPELVAGAAGLAFLAWLADDPRRPAGGVGRARTVLLLPALALGTAWAGSLLLPSSSAPIGVAAGLLAVALVSLAVLIARPAVFEREETSSS